EPRQHVLERQRRRGQGRPAGHRAVREGVRGAARGGVHVPGAQAQGRRRRGRGPEEGAGVLREGVRGGEQGGLSDRAARSGARSERAPLTVAPHVASPRNAASSRSPVRWLFSGWNWVAVTLSRWTAAVIR